jgi:thiol:disulfide interchange protein DsbD
MSLSLLDYLPFYTPYSQGTNIAQPEGSIFRAFCFGLVSGFIFSPCVSAPLMGALVFITTSQDYILGATSLFLLGIGMGIPLIAAAIFGTRILPKRGAWMNQIKVLCAVLLLALSIYLLSRIVTSPIVMTLTGLLALGYGLYLLRITHTRKRILQLIMNVIGAFSLLYGCALFVGVWRGHYNLYHPLQSSTPSETQLPWIAASNAVTLEQELQYAKESGLPSIVDVYASWCIACQHIEQEVIPDEKVQKQLAPFVRIHLDVSQADEATYAWLKAHYVFGPPAQLLFDADGRALTDQTLYGEITITQLIQALERAQH